MLIINEPQLNKVDNPPQSFSQWPIFDLLFRSHFLLGSAASIFSLMIWLSYTTHGIGFSSNGLSPLVWHIHEMIFTFASTIAVGFILTAVQTWTGKPSVKGKKAVVLISMWLFSHVLFWLNTSISVGIGLMMKTFWWLLVIGFYTKIVMAAKNLRNFVFIAMLSIMASLNFCILLLDLTNNTALALHLAKTMVLVFVVLITLLGGRVIPFFTVNGAKTAPITSVKWLERSVFLLSILSAVVYAASYWFDVKMLLTLVLFVAGTLHSFRLTRWKTLKTFNVPLLWSLHLAYLFMSLGLIAMSFSHNTMFSAVPPTYGIHLITVGSIGLMILSMMSRVSLGHTGRMLHVSKLITFAFLLMIFATVSRVILPVLGITAWGWAISALCWIVAFGSFLYRYIPILTKARL